MPAVVESPEHARHGAAEHPAVACSFTLGADLRFLSHRDELRMLARALRRAGWPLAYSRGFNPQPRIVLPLPRRVGTASECQCAVVRLDEPRALEWLAERLAAELPAACRLRCVSALPPRAKLAPRRVVFAVALEPRHAAEATPRIPEVLAAETLTVERDAGPDRPPRIVDIRPYIETITLADHTLSMRLVFGQRRTARPSEVLKVLRLPATVYHDRFRQVEVEWNMALAGPNYRPPGPERNNVVQEENRYSQTKNHP
jgi:radical SAM-linked protein